MTTRIGVQKACRGCALPDSRAIRGWARAAIADRRAQATLTVRLVGEDEGAALNGRFRNRPGPTNVLSFEGAGLEGIDPAFLGDVVICAPLVALEAEAQHKPLSAHFAHLVIHGVLHLLGYDHDKPGRAAVMEGLETEILAGLGFPDPYAPRPDP